MHDMKVMYVIVQVRISGREFSSEPDQSDMVLDLGSRMMRTKFLLISYPVCGIYIYIFFFYGNLS